jgi:hypothetical protein
MGENGLELQLKKQHCMLKKLLKKMYQRIIEMFILLEGYLTSKNSPKIPPTTI